MTLEEKLKDEREEGRQEGLKEGRQKGLKEGRQEGIKEGLKEGQREIIERMLQTLPAEEVSRMLGMNEAELKKIIG